MAFRVFDPKTGQRFTPQTGGNQYGTNNLATGGAGQAPGVTGASPTAPQPATQPAPQPRVGGFFPAGTDPNAIGGATGPAGATNPAAPQQPGMFAQVFQNMANSGQWNPQWAQFGVQAPTAPNTGTVLPPGQGDQTPLPPDATVDPSTLRSHLGNEYGPLGVGPGVGNRIQQMGGGLLHSGNAEQQRLLEARAGGAPLTGNVGGDPADLTGRTNTFLTGTGQAPRAGFGSGTSSSDILRNILSGQSAGSPLSSDTNFGGATGFTPVIPGQLPQAPGGVKPPEAPAAPATPGRNPDGTPLGTGGGFMAPPDQPFTIPFGNDMIGPGHPIWERLMGGSAGASADGTNSGGEMIPWQEATPRDVLPGGDTTVYGTTATGHRIGSIDPRISAGIDPFEPATNTFAFGSPSGYGAIGPQSEEQMRAQAEQQAARLEAIRNQQQQPWHTAYGVGPQQRPEFWNAQGGYIGPDLNAVQGWMNESDPYGVDEYGNSLNAYGETGLNQPAPGNNLYPVPAGGNQQSGGGGGGGLGGLGGLLGGAGGDGASALGNIFGGNLNVPIEPILTSQQIQALINDAIGQNISTEQGAVNRARENFAGRGLSGGSPGMQSVENRLGLNRAIADTQARTQIPIEAARLNAGYTTDALEGLSRQRSLDIGAWSAAQNAQTGAISPFLSALVALMG